MNHNVHLYQLFIQSQDASISRRKVALSLASEAQWPQLALVLQKSGAEAFRQWFGMGIGWESSPNGAEVAGISEWVKWIIIIYPDIV